MDDVLGTFVYGWHLAIRAAEAARMEAWLTGNPLDPAVAADDAFRTTIQPYLPQEAEV